MEGGQIKSLPLALCGVTEEKNTLKATQESQPYSFPRGVSHLNANFSARTLEAPSLSSGLVFWFSSVVLSLRSRKRGLGWGTQDEAQALPKKNGNRISHPPPMFGLKAGD